MPTTLPLSDASFKQVSDFFLNSPPDAVIGARENGDGEIELYRRDDLKGKEWFKDLFILGKTRQNNYEKAKLLISQKTRDTAWSNPFSGAAHTLGHILTQHKQNFHAGDFIDLNNQVKARHTALKGLRQAFVELKMGKLQRNEFSDAIGRINSSVFAKALCPLTGSARQMEKIESTFNHFKNFVKVSLDTIESPVSIDYVAVLNLAKELQPVLAQKISPGAWDDKAFDKALGKQLLGVFSNVTFVRDAELAKAHTIKRIDLPEKKDIPKPDQRVLKNMSESFVADRLVRLGSENEQDLQIEEGIKALRTYYDGKSADKANVDFEAILALKKKITEILLLESMKTLAEDPKLLAVQEIKSLCAHLGIRYPYT